MEVAGPLGTPLGLGKSAIRSKDLVARREQGISNLIPGSSYYTLTLEKLWEEVHLIFVIFPLLIVTLPPS